MIPQLQPMRLQSMEKSYEDGKMLELMEIDDMTYTLTRDGKLIRVCDSIDIPPDHGRSVREA